MKPGRVHHWPDKPRQLIRGLLQTGSGMTGLVIIGSFALLALATATGVAGNEWWQTGADALITEKTIADALGQSAFVKSSSTNLASQQRLSRARG